MSIAVHEQCINEDCKVLHNISHSSDYQEIIDGRDTEVESQEIKEGRFLVLNVFGPKFKWIRVGDVHVIVLRDDTLSKLQVTRLGPIVPFDERTAKDLVLIWDHSFLYFQIRCLLASIKANVVGVIEFFGQMIWQVERWQGWIANPVLYHVDLSPFAWTAFLCGCHSKN